METTAPLSREHDATCYVCRDDVVSAHSGTFACPSCSASVHVRCIVEPMIKGLAHHCACYNGHALVAAPHRMEIAAAPAQYEWCALGWRHLGYVLANLAFLFATVFDVTNRTLTIDGPAAHFRLVTLGVASAVIEHYSSDMRIAIPAFNLSGLLYKLYIMASLACFYIQYVDVYVPLLSALGVISLMFLHRGYRSLSAAVTVIHIARATGYFEGVTMNHLLFSTFMGTAVLCIHYWVRTILRTWRVEHRAVTVTLHDTRTHDSTQLVQFAY